MTPMPCGHCRTNGCRYCAMYAASSAHREVWEPPLLEGQTTVLGDGGGGGGAPLQRARKPKVSIEELATKRRRCQERKRQGLPCDEFGDGRGGGGGGIGGARSKGAIVEVTESLTLRPVARAGGDMAPRWAYGLTTVPQRRRDLLPRTLKSLREAGFPSPVLFIDGADHAITSDYEREFSLPAVGRWPLIRTFGNWILGLAELTIRNPLCDRFAMFQDDFVTSKNLRTYLDACPFPDGESGRPKGYWNLYTFEYNWARAPRTGREGRTGERVTGWFPAVGKGLGAVALVFNREGAWDLLTAKENIITRPAEAGVRAYSAIDGGIVDAMRKKGYREFCHNPSLVQHLGIVSTMGNNRHPSAKNFLGEGYDLMELMGRV